MTTKGIKVKCTKKECGHIWWYRGISRFYITCSVCYNKVRLEKAIITK
ncbi:MAG: hypothetical protein AABY22_01660 [Nanoarchaeota archaeon]